MSQEICPICYKDNFSPSRIHCSFNHLICVDCMSQLDDKERCPYCRQDMVCSCLVCNELVKVKYICDKCKEKHSYHKDLLFRFEPHPYFDMLKDILMKKATQSQRLVIDKIDLRFLAVHFIHIEKMIDNNVDCSKCFKCNSEGDCRILFNEIGIDEDLHGYCKNCYKSEQKIPWYKYIEYQAEEKIHTYDNGNFNCCNTKIHKDCFGVSIYFDGDQNGIIREISNFINDDKYGIFRWYYKNGNIKEIGNMIRNSYVGLVKKYFKSGELQKETYYELQSIIWEKEYYQSGKLKCELNTNKNNFIFFRDV